MKANLTRTESSDQGTFGLLVLENGQHWHSLELPWRDNSPQISCIPEGTYTAKLEWSNHFQRNVYHLQDVPGRSNVEIHPANFAGDASQGWEADLLGCIALGRGVSVMPNKLGNRQQCIIGSRDAIGEFESALNGEALELTVQKTDKVA